MPLIPFPNVPKLPGVPQLLRSAVGSLPPAVGLGAIAVGRLAQAFTSTVQWGIFDSTSQARPRGILSRIIKPKLFASERKPVINPDSIIDFGYRNDYQISNFPVQQGQFASYNKVATPFEIQLRLTKGGSKADRVAFLQEVDAVVASTKLFTVLTPEKEYMGLNLSRYEVSRRGVQGAFFLTDVDLFFIQIREVQPSYTSSSAATSNSSVDPALPPENQGQVQLSRVGQLKADGEKTLARLQEFNRRNNGGSPTDGIP